MSEPSIPEPVNVKLKPERTAVIVVDMQNDFCHPNGKLFVPSSVATIPAIRRIVDNARKNGVKVFYTQDWHQPEDPEFEIWGEHALAYSWGAQIVDELKPSESDIVVQKLRYDGFYGTSLEHLLRLHHVTDLVITGTVANICVLHTAGSAALRWFRIYVPVDGISALNEFDMKAALRQITFLYRGILTSSELIEFAR
ncbi:MAG: isochorismatase family cysteine hydrolase [Candidatus Caldarchaeum sp.]